MGCRPCGAHNLAPIGFSSSRQQFERVAVTGTNRGEMAVVEGEGAFVRRGRNGVRQEQVAGVLVAAFDHRTSRTGDPQLHTHVAVLRWPKQATGRCWPWTGGCCTG